MKYRCLGRTGLNVSLLSLGSGGPNRFGQLRYVPPRRIERLVHVALEHGVNFFDTSASYQLSEELLGRALRGTPRDRYFLASKLRAHANGRPISESEVRRLVERSLDRLGTGELDLMQLHGVLPGNYHEAVERLLPVLENLRSEGKIRFIGITEATIRDPRHEMLQQALKDDHFDTVMVAYHPSNTGAVQDVLPRAQRKDVGVIVMTAARHLVPRSLADRLKRSGRSFLSMAAYPQGCHGLRHQFNAAVSAWRSPGPAGGQAAGPAAGYAFAASQPAVATVLTGTTDEAHLLQNLEAVEAADAVTDRQ